MNTAKKVIVHTEEIKKKYKKISELTVWKRAYSEDPLLIKEAVRKRQSLIDEIEIINKKLEILRKTADNGATSDFVKKIIEEKHKEAQKTVLEIRSSEADFIHKLKRKMAAVKEELLGLNRNVGAIKGYAKQQSFGA
ncbi:MAG: hypothetical protein ACLFQK_06155 [Fibrobacterota bacterium]